MHISCIEHLLQVSPDIPGYGGGQWAMYSVHCCWWTSFPNDLGSTGPMKMKVGPDKDHMQEIEAPGLPCCPHCGSVLMQAPLKQFVDSAQANPEHYGEFGIDAFLKAHSGNSKTCHRSWKEYNDDIWRMFHPKPPQTFA